MFPILLTLALGADTAAGPTLKLPAQVQAQPGKHFVVKAETNLKWVRWTIPPGLERVPPHDTAYGEAAFVGYGPAGMYEFKVEGTFNDQYKDATCVVFVGQPAPGPLPPGPGPAPVPPWPPADPIASELQALFTADKDPLKAGQRDKLAELWKQAAFHIEGNPELTTLRQFREAMHAQGGKFPFWLTDGNLAACRQKLGGELKTMCGGDENCPLGVPKSELRVKGKALLERYAVALATVK